jgi:hypothetical protein
MIHKDRKALGPSRSGHGMEINGSFGRVWSRRQTPIRSSVALLRLRTKLPSRYTRRQSRRRGNSKRPWRRISSETPSVRRESSKKDPGTAQPGAGEQDRKRSIPPEWVAGAILKKIYRDHCCVTDIVDAYIRFCRKFSGDAASAHGWWHRFRWDGRR